MSMRQLVIVIIINILLVYLGNNNKSRFGMSWIELIRIYGQLEVLEQNRYWKQFESFKLVVRKFWIQGTNENEEFVFWVRNSKLGFEYMFNSVSLKEVWVKSKVKMGNKDLELCILNTIEFPPLSCYVNPVPIGLCLLPCGECLCLSKKWYQQGSSRQPSDTA